MLFTKGRRDASRQGQKGMSPSAAKLDSRKVEPRQVGLAPMLSFGTIFLRSLVMGLIRHVTESSSRRKVQKWFGAV